MFPIEVKHLGLYDINNILAFKNQWKPKEVLLCLADTHFGDSISLSVPKFTCLNGTVVEASNTSKQIYNKGWKPMVKISKAWGVTQAFHGGDVISATSHKFKDSKDFLNPDDSKELAIQVLKQLGNIKWHFISGTPAHDSDDTLVSLDIARSLGGEFHYGGMMFKKINQVRILLSHKHRKQALWVEGVGKRETILLLSGMYNEDVPEHDINIGGHFHRYLQISNNKLAYIDLPGWQGYYPIKGDTTFWALRNPQVGAVIILVRGKKFLILPYLFPIKTFGYS